MDSNDFQEQLFSAIEVIMNQKIKDLRFDQCVEVIIQTGLPNSDGSLTVLYQDTTFDAFPQGGVSFSAGDVVYMLVVNSDFSKKKIIISSKAPIQDTTDDSKLTINEIMNMLNTSTLIVDDDNLSQAAQQAIAERHTHLNSSVLAGTEESFTTVLKQKLNSLSVAAGDTYTFNQVISSATWVITHNLNKFPSVTVVDSGGTVVIGDIVYNSPNQITLTFSGGFSGKAYLN